MKVNDSDPRAKAIALQGGRSAGGWWLVSSGDCSEPVNDQALKRLSLQEEVLCLAEWTYTVRCRTFQFLNHLHKYIHTDTNSLVDCVCHIWILSCLFASFLNYYVYSLHVNCVAFLICFLQNPFLLSSAVTSTAKFYFHTPTQDHNFNLSSPAFAPALKLSMNILLLLF